MDWTFLGLDTFVKRTELGTDGKSSEALLSDGLAASSAQASTYDSQSLLKILFVHGSGAKCAVEIIKTRNQITARLALRIVNT